jgi:multiple sugar transport system permease protein
MAAHPATHPGPARARRGRLPGRARVREALTGYAFILPNLALFAAFMFLPLAWTFVLSTQETSGFGPVENVGLDNYRAMFEDPVFWRSLINTVGYAAISVPLSLAGGLGLALLINKALPGRGIFRSIYFIPTVISAVAAGLVCQWMFEENVGIVNKMITGLGFEPVAWQSSTVGAIVSVTITTQWVGIGLFMVIYLASLQGIPREYYEAASVDGANAWQQFRHITLPGLRGATFFLVIYGIIGSFQVFDLIFVLTGGGPGDATEVLGTYAYDRAFETRERGYGAAIGVVLYVLLMVVTIIQWQANKRRED